MPETVSEIETVLRRRAERLGVPFKDLLEHDRQAFRAGAAVHSDCPPPDFVKNILDENKAVRDVVLHLMKCPTCASMTEVMSQVASASPQLVSRHPQLTVSLVSTEGKLKTLERIEREVIEVYVAYNHGQMSETARTLGIGRSTLYRKLDELAPVHFNYIG